mgnify:CR=1 FL=1
MCTMKPDVSGTLASQSEPMAMENMTTDIGVMGSAMNWAAITVRLAYLYCFDCQRAGADN